MADQASARTGAWNVAGLVVRVQVTWEAAWQGVVNAMAYHDVVDTDRHADLLVRIVRPGEYSENARMHRGSTQTFETIYGRFIRAHWDLAGSPRVTLAPTMSPLRLVRPIVDSEGHAIHQDVGRMVHERVLPTMVQLGLTPHRCSFLHGAAMVDPDGNGVVISGVGGVGKTSLALEVGIRHGWTFVSDDMVLIDSVGRMHLNGNAPKLYAYNVIGDPELEETVLGGRGIVDRVHWQILKRWPNRVRRSVSPADLYGSTVDTAPFRRLFLVERGPWSSIDLEPMTTEAAAHSASETLVDELRKMTPDVLAFLQASNEGHRFAWGQQAWFEVLMELLDGVDILAVRVPQNLGAVEYRRQMVDILHRLPAV